MGGARGEADPAAVSSRYLAKWPVTRLQVVTLRVVSIVCERHGVPPTLRELVHLLGLRNRLAVASRLNPLERKGLIERVPGRERAARLTEAGKAAIR